MCEGKEIIGVEEIKRIMRDEGYIDVDYSEQ